MNRTTKIPGDNVLREPAHNGEGERKVYLQYGSLSSQDFETMTVGYLQPGGTFSQHQHKGFDEIMYVVRGYGFVEAADIGRHTYKPGDCFTFPARALHAIQNMSDKEAEFLFVRIASL